MKTLFLSGCCPSPAWNSHRRNWWLWIHQAWMLTICISHRCVSSTNVSHRKPGPSKGFQSEFLCQIIVNERLLFTKQATYLGPTEEDFWPKSAYSKETTVLYEYIHRQFVKNWTGFWKLKLSKNNSFKKCAPNLFWHF